MPPVRPPPSPKSKPYSPKASRTPKPGPRPSLRASDSAPTDLAPSGKRWTGEEYVALFDHVAVHGAAKFEAAVPGRTKNQCYQAFKCTVAPMCRAMLAAKGEEKGKAAAQPAGKVVKEEA
ncbi:uncharacterized protein LOC62_06G008182 [Vanrija pseudolonga]|uniref:Myb-like domain-containing protein n=1 Tax=Vanrija pseudolonga TaxID=143232 RepID=A0AAF0YDB1_9TREE|nr:hypothetical protein LOC62_06G008182 [Vanrija pseudolonga]